MNINEIFYSIQGEGLLAGRPSVFIRLPGCPLKCTWCDTSYAQDYSSGEYISLDKVLEQVNNHPTEHVVLTGGEPLVQADMTERKKLRDLLSTLRLARKHITIETAGLAYFANLNCDLMSISPKISNASLDTLVDKDALQQLVIDYNCQFKFVIDAPGDINEVTELVESITGIDKDRVMLMPQAANRQQYLEKAAMVAELCMESGYTFSPRLQTLLWDSQRGR